MNKLTEVTLKPFQRSKFIKPLTMHYTLNGKDRIWDLLEMRDGVAIVIYNITRNVLVLVKQFRPAVYFGHIATQDRKGIINIKKYPVELGISLELCAGIVDKKISFARIAQEEIIEECGYKVAVSDLQRVASCRAGVGTLSSLLTTYYCEVTDDMKVSPGGGIDDECIEIVEFTIPEIKEYVCQSNLNSPTSCLNDKDVDFLVVLVVTKKQYLKNRVT